MFLLQNALIQGLFTFLQSWKNNPLCHFVISDVTIQKSTLGEHLRRQCVLTALQYHHLSQGILQISASFLFFSIWFVTVTYWEKKQRIQEKPQDPSKLFVLDKDSPSLFINKTHGAEYTFISHPVRTGRDLSDGAFSAPFFQGGRSWCLINKICPLSDSLLDTSLEPESKLFIPGLLCFLLLQAVSKSLYQNFNDIKYSASITGFLIQIILFCQEVIINSLGIRIYFENSVTAMCSLPEICTYSHVTFGVQIQSVAP